LAEQPLAGCRALLIRPSSGDTQLQQRLAALGAEWLHTPVMTLPRLPEAPQRVSKLLADLNAGGLALFVSRTAATIAVELAGQWSLQAECYAVGESTAQVLADAGLKVGTPPKEKQTSEGLLALPALNAINGRQVIIVAGEGGRHLIGTTLTERGARVSRCELYRRTLDPAGQQRALGQLAQCNLLFAHSGEILAALGAAADPQLLLVVPSQRVAEQALALGYQQVAVAAAATATAMTEAASQLWRQRYKQTNSI